MIYLKKPYITIIYKSSALLRFVIFILLFENFSELKDLGVFTLLYPKLAIPLASKASSTKIPTTFDLLMDSLLDI